MLRQIVGRRYTIADLQAQAVLRNISMPILRRKVRIAVIDDEPFQPLENLLDESYDVTFMGGICRAELCERYDILLCDIQSVGVDLNGEEQGAAVVGQIKRIYPDKYVIVYSALDRRSRILRLALDRSDNFIAKSSSQDLIYSVLDTGVRWILDPEKIWERTNAELRSRNVSTKNIAELEHKFVKSVLSGDPKPLRRLALDASRGQEKPEIRSIATGILSSAIWSVLSGGVQ